MRALWRCMAAGALGCALALIAGCTSAPPVAESPTASPEGPRADLILHGGIVLTMDDDHPRASAIALAGEEILAVGDDELLDLAGPDTVVVDLGGFTVLPGFVDAHAHYIEHFGDDMVGMQDWILSMGVTTIAELGTRQDVYNRIVETVDAGELRLRVSAYLVAVDNCGTELDDWFVDGLPASTGPRGTLFEVPGVKLFADGGSCGVPAATAPDGQPYGDLWHSQAELEGYIAKYQDLGYQVAVHALGDRAIDEVLSAFDEVMAPGNPLRHRIEHNTIVDPSFAGRYDALNLTGTFFGAYPTCAFSNLVANGSPTVDTDREWNWRRLLDGNPATTFGWSSDAGVPFFPDSTPVRSLVGFTTRVANGEGGPCLPDATEGAGAINMDEALHIMTTGSAYALGRDDEIGMLRPGMLADLTILSDDPTAVDPELLYGSEFVLTIVGGHPEHCAGAFAALCG